VSDRDSRIFEKKSSLQKCTVLGPFLIPDHAYVVPLLTHSKKERCYVAFLEFLFETVSHVEVTVWQRNVNAIGMATG